MNRKCRMMIACLAPLLATSPAWADDNETLTEDEKAKRRLEYMVTAAAKFQFRLPGPPQVTVDVVQTPLLRWSNPQSNSRDGIVVAWSTGGRPVALAQFSTEAAGHMVHGFHTTCTEAVEMARGDRVYCRFEKPTITFEVLEDLQSPAESKALRTAQIRRLAEEFEVLDEFGWRLKEHVQLRLLRQPVYRYEDASHDVIDGAVMVYALSNTPEAVLLIEAFDTDDGPRWRYSFSPMTIYALEARRGEEVVWQIPERRVFGRGHQGQYVSYYSPDPSDPPLKPLLPNMKAKREPAAREQ